MPAQQPKHKLPLAQPTISIRPVTPLARGAIYTPRAGATRAGESKNPGSCSKINTSALGSSKSRTQLNPTEPKLNPS